MQSIPIERVTPKKAAEWLNANTSNRKLREGVVEKYAEDMRNGHWTRCTAPICFYEDGDVADGQHRLWAIVESETTQEFAILRGLSRSDGLNIDTGLNRSLVDNARISGADKELSNELISVSRAIEEGDKQRGQITNSRRLEFVDKHRDAARWAVSNGPRGKGLRNAIILGAVGRAYYRESDHNRLRRFCDVFATGLSEGKDESAAVVLRNYFVSKGTGATGSAALWRDSFLKSMNAIAYFMRGQPITVIKRVSDEAYPLKKFSKR